MRSVGMFERRGAYTTDGFAESGADFLPEYRQHIHYGHTVIASPHKIVGPESNDLALQLRKRGVNQVVLGRDGRQSVRGRPPARAHRAGLRSRCRKGLHRRPSPILRRRLPGRAGELPISGQRRPDHRRGGQQVIETCCHPAFFVEVEAHPYHPQGELHELCATEDIILLAFASLGHALEPRLLDDPLIADIARSVGKTRA